MDVTARAFVETLFGQDSAETGYTVVARKNPVGFSSFAAYGTADHAPTIDLVTPESGEGWYTCVSKVAADPEIFPKLSRKNEQVVAAYVLMLDDIGSKAANPPLRPTAILETSKGNFQWVYKLAEPETAIDRYDHLVNLLVDKGFGDRGAKGSVRLFRLPGSLNAKPGKNSWKTRVTEWSPHKAFTLEEIAEAFGVELTPSVGCSGSSDPLSQELFKTRDALGVEETKWVETYGPKFHPAIEYLMATGGVHRVETGPRMNPVFHVRCPNAHEHTDPNDPWAKLQLPIGHSPQSWLYCHHGHCRHIRASHLFENLAQLMSAKGAQVFPETFDYVWLKRYFRAKYIMVGKSVRDVFQAADRPQHDPVLDLEVARLQWKRMKFNGVVPNQQKPIQLFDIWSNQCNKFVGEVFRPDRPELNVDGYLNVHRLSYRFGTAKPNPKHIALLKELVFGLCGDPEVGEWLLMWLAIKLVRLEARLPGIIFWSETQGHGKSTLGAIVRSVMGHNYVTSVFSKMVAPGSRFNKAQETAAILELNEVHPLSGGNSPAAKRAVYAHLKRLNDPTIDGVIEIEGKGVDAKMAQSFSSVWIFTNDKYEPAIDKHDRRYAAIATQPAAPPNGRLWSDIEKELAKNRYAFGESLYNWAREYSAGKKDLNVIQTPYLLELKRRSFGDDGEDLINDFNAAAVPEAPPG